MLTQTATTVEINNSDVSSVAQKDIIATVYAGTVNPIIKHRLKRSPGRIVFEQPEQSGDEG
jgi:hypothetical protein